MPGPRVWVHLVDGTVEEWDAAESPEFAKSRGGNHNVRWDAGYWVTEEGALVLGVVGLGHPRTPMHARVVYAPGQWTKIRGGEWEGVAESAAQASSD